MGNDYAGLIGERDLAGFVSADKVPLDQIPRAIPDAHPAISVAGDDIVADNVSIAAGDDHAVSIRNLCGAISIGADIIPFNRVVRSINPDAGPAFTSMP